MKLGIDLGTTRTVVAAVDRGHTPVVGFESPDGDVIDTWPSLAATDGRQWVFGPEAALRLRQPGWQGLRSLKRLLTGPDAGPERRVELADRPTVHDLLVGYLSALRQALLTGSNLPLSRGDDRLEVLVAVPAASSSTQRFLTMEAFRAAGFEVTGMLNEPSAAAIEYADRHARTLNSRRERVVVYDLGGGTFDLTQVHLADGAHRVVAHDGRNHLGGEDLDEALLTLACEAAGLDAQALPAAARTRLLEHCRELKEAINPNSRAVTVELGASLGADERASLGVAEDQLVRIPVERFYQAVQPLVDETLQVLRQQLGDGSDALEEHAVAGIYVVGGASSLPLIARSLRDAYGRRVHRSPYPSAATAIGLAIAQAQGVSVADRLSRHLGVFRELDDGARIAFDPVLGPDTPADGSEVRRRYRAAHNLGHFRFVECDHLAGDGSPSGDLTPTGQLIVPFARELRGSRLERPAVRRLAQPGPLIEEAWRVDRSGSVAVRYTDLDDGWSMELQLGG